ncbi:hypothetical protein K438DRAFT_1274890 [Mycena galopus ATCC 62051]|nr:hypothetical protein K438DRAFT_1274890 [Mycena galopus ATCC 62051]
MPADAAAVFLRSIWPMLFGSTACMFKNIQHPHLQTPTFLPLLRDSTSQKFRPRLATASNSTSFDNTPTILLELHSSPGTTSLTAPTVTVST